MRNQVLSVMGDAGGAEAIAPVLVKLVRGGQVDVTILTSQFADPVLQRVGLPTQVIDNDVPPMVAAGWLEEARPDVLLTGTSWGIARIEPPFIEAAVASRIPTISVLDYWSNYRARFADEEGELRYLPDRVAVMDSMAKAMMIDAGIPADRVVVTGAPQYESLIAAGPVDADARRRFRRAEGIEDDDLVVLFVSQPIAALLGTAIGYTERDVLALVRSTLSGHPNAPNLVLALRRHPREYSFERATPPPGLREVDASGSGPEEWLTASDVVIGMNSALLLRAALLGHPVLSVQPGLIGPDVLPSNAMGLSRAIYDARNLEAAVAEALQGAGWEQSVQAREAIRRLSFGATDRVMNLVLGMARSESVETTA